MTTPHTTTRPPRTSRPERGRVLADATTAAALGYARRGWRVFPLAPGDKRPAVRTWQDRATTDPARIERCWSTITGRGPYGIGIACGPSGLLVVDLDRPKPDKRTGRPAELPEPWQLPGVVDGADVLAVLAERAGAPDPGTLGTYTARTPSGGVHLYFTHPEHVPDGRGPLGNTAGSLGPLVDTRGVGGYVAAAPTTTPTGRAYTLDDPHAPVLPLPGWLADALTPVERPPAGPVNVRLTARGDQDERAARYAQAAVDRTLAAVLEAAPGTRNRALYGAASSLGELVAGGALDPAETSAALIGAGVAVGQTEREATATVRSGLRAGAARPRTLTTHPSATDTSTEGAAA